MKRTFPFTSEYLHNLFEYKDGMLFHKMTKAKGKVKAGDRAGSKSSSGYRRLSIDYVEVPEHSAIFVMHHNYCPKVIDHINGCGLDNRIENLRAATTSNNQHNKRLNRNNTSGYKNVSFCRKTSNWAVHIKKNNKVHYWYVKDKDLAILIAEEARIKLHGDFANHG